MYEFSKFGVNESEDAIDLIRDNIHRVHLYSLGLNRNVLKIISKLNYEAMKTKCQSFAKELAIEPFKIIEFM